MSVCVRHVNEMCMVCIFKPVEQSGGEKVTGNGRCLTAPMLLMRASPCFTQTCVKMMGESKVSVLQSSVQVTCRHEGYCYRPAGMHLWLQFAQTFI